MNIRIFVFVEVGETVNNDLRLLCRRCIIQPNERLAVHAFLQDWKVSPDRSYIELSTGKVEVGRMVGGFVVGFLRVESSGCNGLGKSSCVFDEVEGSCIFQN